MDDRIADRGKEPEEGRNGCQRREGGDESARKEARVDDEGVEPKRDCDRERPCSRREQEPADATAAADSGGEPVPLAHDREPRDDPSEREVTEVCRLAEERAGPQEAVGADAGDEA